MATPQISTLLAPFEHATSGKESAEKFKWNFDLEKQFRHAKNQIEQLITLYLPAPKDQLVLQTDGSKQGLGSYSFCNQGRQEIPCSHSFSQAP